MIGFCLAAVEECDQDQDAVPFESAVASRRYEALDFGCRWPHAFSRDVMYRPSAAAYQRAAALRPCRRSKFARTFRVLGR